MSGIYNIGHCVMPWWISNCAQGSSTCLFAIDTAPECILSFRKFPSTLIFSNDHTIHEWIQKFRQGWGGRPDNDLSQRILQKIKRTSLDPRGPIVSRGDPYQHF